MPAQESRRQDPHGRASPSNPQTTERMETGRVRLVPPRRAVQSGAPWPGAGAIRSRHRYGATIGVEVFGKHGLLKDGAEAKAVATSVDLYQGGMRGNWGTGFTYDVALRVHFDDDTTADVVRRIGGMSGTD